MILELIGLWVGFCLLYLAETNQMHYLTNHLVHLLLPTKLADKVTAQLERLP